MTSGQRLPKGLSPLALFSVTMGGLGLLRPASGSWGSLPPVALALLIVWSGAPWWVLDVSLALTVLFGTIACVKFGKLAEEAFGAKDPSSVVADETAGCAVTLLAVPWWMIATGDSNALVRTAIVCATGFFFFRLFDVWKPGYVGDLQSQPHGWGIVLDDLAAGAWAWPPTILSAVIALQYWA